MATSTKRQFCLPFMDNISMSGRFGNQCILYVLGVALAKFYEAELCVKPWPGHEIFDIKINPVPDNCKLCDPLPLWFDGAVGVKNAFCIPPRVANAVRHEGIFREVLKIKPEFVRKPKKAVLHFRRFDKENVTFAKWFRLDELLACVENAGFKRDEIHVVSDSDLHTDEYQQHKPFIEDFLDMVYAENLFIYPLSTFSGLAAELNTNHFWDLNGDSMQFVLKR